MCRKHFSLVAVLFLLATHSIMAKTIPNSLPDASPRVSNFDPQFEVGTIDYNACGRNVDIFECKITFKNKYLKTPLVFVMPTIDQNNSIHRPRQTEYPSTAKVVGVTKTSATIAQKFPSHDAASKRVKFLDKFDPRVTKEMGRVDYLIIEPGIIELNNGAKIIAGSVEIKNKKGKRDKSFTFVPYVPKSHKRFFAPRTRPSVLAQIQTTRNKSDVWSTAAIHKITERGFLLKLHSAEVENKIKKKEVVGFVAGIGSGELNGIRFWTGKGKTLSTRHDPISPVLRGCNKYNSFPSDADLNGNPILIAKANTTKGSNGGWIRRCNLTNKAVSFVLEEDMYHDSERGHISEDVGYFMFEKPEVPDKPKHDYRLEITPASQYILTCDREANTVDIKTFDLDEAEQTSIHVEVFPKAGERDLNISVVGSIGSGKYPNFKTGNSGTHKGKLRLSISPKPGTEPKLNEKFVLRVTLLKDKSKSQSSTFKFVPFKFEASDVSFIAGKKQSLETKVLACKNNKKTVVKNYTGTPNVGLVITAPSHGNSNRSLLNYSPHFSSSDKGLHRDDDFSIQESGRFTVKLSDPNFICDEKYSSDCPISSSGPSKPTMLSGSFEVISRPWKVAICDVKSDKNAFNPKTLGDLEGFMPSGEVFSIRYKPIIYRELTGNENVCDASYPSTENYYSLSKSKRAVSTETKFELAYPTGGSLGNFKSERSVPFDSPMKARNGSTIDYVWEESGSMKLTTSGSYMGNKLDNDEQIIGRFYPKYFQSYSNIWGYPNRQDFVYMGQPFESVEFSVSPLSANFQSTKNYALFDNKAKFNLVEYSNHSSRFISPEFGDGKWVNISDTTIGTFQTSKQSLCKNLDHGVCWMKGVGDEYPDGPFNGNSISKTKIGLEYLNNADPVEYRTDDSGQDSRFLLFQPEIRFGRIDLDDVGIAQGLPVHIPLRTEFWSGDRFVVNDRDSQTRVNVSDNGYYQKSVWPTDGSSVQVSLSLDNPSIVDKGKLRSIVATEARPHRQQTKVWLDLSAKSNLIPWLTYDWDKDGNEDNPYSVVTYGINRGNDRVIYRGEPGMLGLSK